ncbi:MAG: hypothetical protein H7Z17_18190 [Fuerstia sp.]|nr:hypothetical protein [Fuerstiella sp.]
MARFTANRVVFLTEPFTQIPTCIASPLSKGIQVADTTEGKRILRSGAAPDLEEVTAWIAAAQQPTTSKVA